MKREPDETREGERHVKRNEDEEKERQTCEVNEDVKRDKDEKKEKDTHL